MFWINAKLISLRRGSLADQIQQISSSKYVWGPQKSTLKNVSFEIQIYCLQQSFVWRHYCDVAPWTRLSSCKLIHARLRYAAGTELFVQGVTTLFRARYARVFGLRLGALGGPRRVLKNCILRLSMISIWFLSKLFMFFKRKSFHPYVICSNYQLLVNFLCVAPLIRSIFLKVYTLYI